MTAPTPSTSVSHAEWATYIENARNAWRNVGVAVAGVRGSEVVYAEGFGTREAGGMHAVDVDTLFQIGSTTKAFAAAAIGLLVEDGLIRWDDRVIDHFPEFQLRDPWLTRRVTVRDALAHRSGIGFSIWPFFATMGPDDAVRHLRYAPAEGAFRDSFLYNNLMYAAAGKVTEEASRMNWHDFVKRRLFQPLKMDRSGTSPYDVWDAQYVAPTFLGAPRVAPSSADDSRESNVAMPHAFTRDGSVIAIPWQSYDNAAAAGSLVSSVAEIANWIVMHVDEGRFEGERVLNKDTMRALHETQNHSADDWFPLEESTQGYTMGWWRAAYRGHSHLAHSGGILGFPAYVALIPDRRVGVVVLANGPKVVSRDYGLNKAIAFWLLDRLLGLPERDWAGEFLRRDLNLEHEADEAEAKLCSARLTDASPSLPLDRYVGAYGDEEGNLSVSLNGNALTLSFPGEGAFSALLEHWHRDVFRLRASAGVMDVLNASGPAFQFATFAIDASATVATMSALGGTFHRRGVDEEQ